MSRTEMKQIREKVNYNQSQVAEKLGISREYYCAVERGKYDATIAFWQIFQDIFDVPNEYMWGIINESN